MNIPFIIVDDARTEVASTYIGTDQVASDVKAADYLAALNPNGGDVAQIEGQERSPNGAAAAWRTDSCEKGAAAGTWSTAASCLGRRLGTKIDATIALEHSRDAFPTHCTMRSLTSG